MSKIDKVNCQKINLGLNLVMQEIFTKLIKKIKHLQNLQNLNA